MTTASGSDAAPPDPFRRLLTSSADYQAAIDELLGTARTMLRMFDPDGRDLGLDRAARVAQLDTFLARERAAELRIALHTTDFVTREAPRLLALLKRYADRIHIHRTEGEAQRAQDCFLIADDRGCVRRAVASQSRGVYIAHDPNELALQRERFEEIWAYTYPAVSATTLGL